MIISLCQSSHYIFQILKHAYCKIYLKFYVLLIKNFKKKFFILTTLNDASGTYLSVAKVVVNNMIKKTVKIKKKFII